ncbi:uncharacterized protein LOC120001481 isoform X2 [Tripterygium wilfordii]|uniref:uncharacterized protein LOC120001481 isoform X2 n=1 Tax=Tripterygium wilfordii TaxID=458696 RepID=UPI0018F8048A|nr:uncharacterized protein LOC120001481 isoform X2 [Tripterygium wilfordii]
MKCLQRRSGLFGERKYKRSSDSEVVPEDNSSEDDEEVIVVREKVRNYKRGWKDVYLLQESDKEGEDDDEQVDDEHDDEQVHEEQDDEQNDEGLGYEEYDEEPGESEKGVDSDYLDSSDPGSYRDSTDEDPEVRDDAIRKRSRFPSYKKVKGILKFELSMLFTSNNEFKDAVSNYAIMTRIDIRFSKNEPSRCRAKCKGATDCPWLIFASYSRQVDSFQVKTYVNEHTCQPKRGLKWLTTKYMVKRFYGFIAAHPDIKIRYLKPFMEQALELDVSLGQCKRVRKTVLADLTGSCVKEYAQLRNYAEELMLSNPGSTVSLLTDRQDENGPAPFKAFYCCFKACKEGFMKGCRPILGIDGCFLKGLVKGELLTAIGRDGNNQMFPLAWVVVLVENTETWTWFLNLLKHDLGTAEGELWTLISDRQKGLVAAVADTWPKAYHRFCCRHLYANWCKNYPGRHLKHLFWQLAKSTNMSDFELNFKEIEKVHPAAAKDLMLVHPKYWSKAYFSPWCQCDSCDNNLCEAFNGTIVEARSKSIISMLEDIRRAMMRRIRDKKLGVNSWKQEYGPLIHRRLIKNVTDSHLWVCEWNGGGSYEVKNGRSQFVVKLRDGTCTCGAWQISGIPCPHASRATHANGEKPEDYLALWYRKETYLRAYQVPIEPIRGENMWPRSEQDHLLPPKMRKMPGRPKKKRRREQHETVNKTKLTREGRIMTCKVCKGKGHNARNKACPGRMTSSSQVSGLTSTNEPRMTRQTSQASQTNEPRMTRQTSAAVASMQGGSNEPMQGQPSRTRHVSPFHRECRPKTKPKKRTLLTGLGLYINPNTGRSILNPGTSMSRVIDRGSENMKNKKHGVDRGSSRGQI